MRAADDLAITGRMQALDIEVYVRSLMERHPDIPVLRDLVTEMRGTLELVREQLIQVFARTRRWTATSPLTHRRGVCAVAAAAHSVDNVSSRRGLPEKTRHF